MKTKSTGFIGGGRITKIFLKAFAKSGIHSAEIFVSDPNAEALSKLKKEFPNIITTLKNSEAAGQDIVFLSVHPPVMSTTLNEISGSLKKNSILISLAPKFTVEKIKSQLKGFEKIGRMIPNAPSVNSRGFNPATFSKNISDIDKSELMLLFNSLGKTKEVSEEKLEAYAVLTAMGPTYFWFQFNELKKLSMGFGLSEEDSVEGISEMINGTIDTIFNSRMKYDEVTDLVPVKPLGDSENIIIELYRTKLNEVFNRIKPL
jgi:pyrroline-5-carboxylate reductase